MTKAIATPSSATYARHRQGEGFKSRSDLEDHSVTRRPDLGSQALSHVGGQLPWMCAPHGHPEVSQNGESRLGVADDSLRVVEAEVREALAALHQHKVDDHDLGLVLFGDALVVLGVGHPSKLVAEAKPERLHLVPVA